MQLVQILLPLTDNTGKRFPARRHRLVQKELTQSFGGLTAYLRSPAYGQWRKRNTTHHDDIVVYEVMTPKLNRAWWRSYQTELEGRFRQSKVVIRSQTVTVL